MGFWPVVITLIKKSNIVGVVADARMPELSLNKGVINWIEKFNKPYVLIFTKKDLVSQEALKEIEKQYPDSILVAGAKNIGVSGLKRHLLIMGKRLGFEEPIVGFVGYPNVGKSALINALAHSRKARVANVPGTTKGVQWVKAGSLKILDSPGVIPTEDKHGKLALLGAKSPEKMNNPEKSACLIIEELKNKDPQSLIDFYSLTELDKDSYDILLAIGLKRKYLLKGGVIDERRASIQIIRDWQNGKLKV